MITAGETIRKVGGKLRSSETLVADELRIEYIRRDTAGSLSWHFRNPRLCLFWYRSGAKSLRASISGKQVEMAFPGGGSFALYPPGTEIEGEWTTGPRVDYAAVFFPTDLVSAYLPHHVVDPVLAFRDDWLAGSLNELRAEAGIDDELSRLQASGWVLQALARLCRRVGKPTGPGQAEPMDMADWQIRQLDAHIEANLGTKLSVAGMAKTVGVSRRHFSRLFQRAFGTSPHRYLTQRRVKAASALLAKTDLSITEIALETGFASSQHFANAFKVATGRTASGIRKAQWSTQ